MSYYIFAFTCHQVTGLFTSFVYKFFLKHLLIKFQISFSFSNGNQANYMLVLFVFFSSMALNGFISSVQRHDPAGQRTLPIVLPRRFVCSAPCYHMIASVKRTCWQLRVYDNLVFKYSKVNINFSNHLWDFLNPYEFSCERITEIVHLKIRIASVSPCNNGLGQILLDNLWPCGYGLQPQHGGRMTRLVLKYWL